MESGNIEDQRQAACQHAPNTFHTELSSRTRHIRVFKSVSLCSFNVLGRQHKRGRMCWRVAHIRLRPVLGLNVASPRNTYAIKGLLTNPRSAAKLARYLHRIGYYPVSGGRKSAHASENEPEKRHGFDYD
jgi:hypothetical protein